MRGWSEDEDDQRSSGQESSELRTEPGGSGCQREHEPRRQDHPLRELTHAHGGAAGRVHRGSRRGSGRPAQECERREEHEEGRADDPAHGT